MVTELRETSEGSVFAKKTNALLMQKSLNVKAKYVKELQFNEGVKDSLLEKVLKGEGEMRNGILPLDWLWKYHNTRPCVVCVLLPITLGINFELFQDYQNKFEETLKRKKIEPLFIIRGKQKNEEYRNQMRHIFKTKNVVWCTASDMSDGVREVESFLLVNSNGFYLNQINKYENHLNKLQRKSNTASEFFIRAKLKLGFTWLMVREFKKAAEQFKQALFIALELL